MYHPISTYRCQFSADFTFSDARHLLDYLEQLGIQTIYASPILGAKKGSSHGYDAIDPHIIQAGLGGWEQLYALYLSLKEKEMGWIQDIVPNHMAYSLENKWIAEIFEWGKMAPHANYFDIDWEHPTLTHKIILPILDKPLLKLFQEGSITLGMNRDGLYLNVYDILLPLSYRSYPFIFKRQGGVSSPPVPPLVADHLSNIPPPISLSTTRMAEWSEWKHRLFRLSVEDERILSYFSSCIAFVNDNQSIFNQLLDWQYFTLVHWHTTERIINYRRFFTVNDLICLNVQDYAVFEDVHLLIRKHINEGYWQGVRVDHIDGLYDPTQYLSQLRALIGEHPTILVEKILEHQEKIPTHWESNGTTGYEFLNWVNYLLTYPQHEVALTHLYLQLTPAHPLQTLKSYRHWKSTQSYDQLIKDDIYQLKRFILKERMNGERENLIRMVKEWSLFPTTWLGKKDIDEMIGLWIEEWLTSFPLYRIYANQFPFSPSDKHLISKVLDQIQSRKEVLQDMVALMRSYFVKHTFSSEDEEKAALKFLQRSMQYTGPLMAKGVEDTYMYINHRFIAHNEVGGQAHLFSLEPEQFHENMIDRQASNPLSLNTTSTHDTKRGEDIRARLLVISECASEWQEVVIQWMDIAHTLMSGNKINIEEKELYFIFQTILGACPMSGQLTEDDFPARLDKYLTKAFREAKLRTSWSQPNKAYEFTVNDLCRQLLKHEGFLESFEAFFNKVVDPGILNSLSQVALKICCPGVPDIYQGSECWNLSLVDPDNRRAIDYQLRRRLLTEIREAQQLPLATLLKELWDTRRSGKIKLWLHDRLLNLRKRMPDLFHQGTYVPLRITGSGKDHLIAFLRRHEEQYLICLVPRFPQQLLKAKHGSLAQQIDWQDTTLHLPDFFPYHWKNELTGEHHSIYEKARITDLLSHFPIATLSSHRSPSDRKAGIFMHISSLPSPFGIGDLGPEAYAFVDFLADSGQRVWQILPLNPVEGSTAYSPYSSPSSFAANTFLISPDILYQQHLISSLPEQISSADGKVDYELVEQQRNELFEEVYQRFPKHSTVAWRNEYISFCQREAYWLNDYALFVAIKAKHQGANWAEWEAAYRFREPMAVEKIKEACRKEIEKEKLLQFLFDQQWRALKSYCHEKGIMLMGDIPIYTSYDSADVWAHPDLFKLDEQLRPKFVAGVPPDYFSETGQLWGMPVFDWERLAATDYQWWVNRIRRNTALFDLIRLDHFRGFSAYWEVPASEKTAVNGAWIKGGGMELFATLKKYVPSLPFVAEDLGEIDEPVYQLRDTFGLPGMLVLQFAFGPEIASNLHITHQHHRHAIVYTGTHDNNTLNGWFENELDSEDQERVRAYLRIPKSETDISASMIQEAYGSIGQTVIVPMQDVLGLGETARMNKPGTTEGNWQWRLVKENITEEVKERLKKWVKLYGRY